MKRERAEYKGLDIVKFIMAVLIVVLHTHPFDGISGILNFSTADVLGRVAVPFFFAATGFLLERKLTDNRGDMGLVIGKYVKGILKLYLVWTVIYFPIILCYGKVTSSERGLKYAILAFFRDTVLNGSYVHLWYLPATAVGVVLAFYAVKWLGMRKAGVLFAILYSMGLLTQSYFGVLLKILDQDGVIWDLLLLVKKVMATCRNGVFFGSVFIYTGIAAAKRPVEMMRKKALSGVILSVVLLWIEEVCLYRYGVVREPDMYWMLVPAAYFLLCTALQIRTEKSTVWFREMSKNIYFVHMIFKFIGRMFLRPDGMALFLFTFAGALAVSEVMFLMKRFRGGRKEAGARQ